MVIGPTTKRQVETAFELEDMGAQDAKGVGKPLETFRVTRSSSPSRSASLPLVGRDFELTVLERTMDALVEGRGAAIVSIMGEPGIGKTRSSGRCATATATARASSRPGASPTQTFPYWPIRDLLREWLGVGASTPKPACAWS